MTDSIDTNIILRCILGDVPEQRMSAINLLKSDNSIHYLSNQALLECIYVLEVVEEMTRQEVVDLLTFFLARFCDHIVYDRNLTAIAFPLYLSHPKLSWADCALASEAELTHHEPLLTFDRKLASQLPQARLVE